MILCSLKSSPFFVGHYDTSGPVRWPRFGKWGLLLTICDARITAKQKASYDVRIDTSIMT